MDKLLNAIPSSFSKDPEKFLAFRLGYAGPMTWSVSANMLTTTVTGGPGGNLAIDLTSHTIFSLVSLLASMPGYTMTDMAANSSAPASCLIDAVKRQDDPHGDELFAHSSLLWAFLKPYDIELTAAGAQVTNMLDQMSTVTADGEWLDEWGGYFGVVRNAGEVDSAFGPRIITEVIRPRNNNVAIEMAIKSAFGQAATVTDVRTWVLPTVLYNGAHSYNGVKTHNSVATPKYGLFDVLCDYNLESGLDQSQYAAAVRALIERFRAAGTQMRSLSLGGTSFSDDVSGQSDAASLTIYTVSRFNGAATFAGSLYYTGETNTTESLS